MHVYDFISKTITEPDVERIIATAGYNPVDYRYEERVGHDGFVARGEEPMSLTRLRSAAKELKIKVEITSPPEALAGPAGSGALVVPASQALAAGTPYQVAISMSTATVSALVNGNYLLYGFKAVQAAQGGGAPLVWFNTGTYSASTVVSWQELYQAYTSNSAIIPNGQIVASFAADIDLGQTLQVQAGGIGTVVNGGPDVAISVLNQTSTPFTCGISQVQAGVATPLCAFPLYGNGLDVIAPIEKVLLMFSSLPVNTGTVVFQAYSQGILIDLTADNQRSVAFDINTGWSWGGFSWAQIVPPSSNLVPLLIEPATVSSKLRLVA
jgi:hypothetical protein